jgi:hypothetical protein
MSDDNPTIGLEAWEARRMEWTTPNETYLAKSEQLKEYIQKCKALIKYEDQRLPIYDKLVNKRETFRSTINLEHLVIKYIFIWRKKRLIFFYLFFFRFLSLSLVGNRMVYGPKE